MGIENNQSRLSRECTRLTCESIIQGNGSVVVVMYRRERLEANCVLSVYPGH